MAKQIRGLHHIVLTVSDLERTSLLYERILGIQSGGNAAACWISYGTFLLAFQLPPHHALPNDCFDENRIGLDHIGFSVDSRKQLEDLLVVLAELHIPTAGTEFDPDGREEYVCFRDPDNIQVKFSVCDYHD